MLAEDHVFHVFLNNMTRITSQITESENLMGSNLTRIQFFEI